MSEKRPIVEYLESAYAGRGDSFADRETDDADRGVPVADGGLQPGALLEALADERRRHVLHYVQVEERATLDEVTEHVAARETGTPPGEVDERTKRTIQIDLYHVQLPKLQQSGIIEYDRQQEVIWYQPSDHVERFIDYCAAIGSSDPAEDPPSDG